MAVGPGSVFPLRSVAGFRLGTARAGIKRPGRRDLVLMELTPGSRVAATFTRNAFCAAPVVLARQHLGVRRGDVRYLLVNTGNANAGTGDPGIDDAEACCRAVSELANCAIQAVLPFSTGVIGEPPPVGRVVAGIPAALAALAESGWEEAAEGIMTTDTRPKGASRSVHFEGRELVVSGIAKACSRTAEIFMAPALVCERRSALEHIASGGLDHLRQGGRHAAMIYWNGHWRCPHQQGVTQCPTS